MARGGAQFITMAGRKRGSNVSSSRPKKVLFRLPLLFGGPVFVAIAVAFFLQAGNRENER